MTIHRLWIHTSYFHLYFILSPTAGSRKPCVCPCVRSHCTICLYEHQFVCEIIQIVLFSEYSCAYKRFLRAKTSVNPWRSQLATYPGGHRASIPSQLRSEERMLFLSRNEIIIIKQNRGHLKSLEHSNKSCLCNGLDLVFVRAKSFVAAEWSLRSINVEKK